MKKIQFFSSHVSAAEFLSVLAKNVATVLSPTLVGELRDGRPNRTAINNASKIFSTTTTSSSTIRPDSSEEPTKSSNLESDTVRSAQTQSEVGRPGNSGNGGFPFNFDDNYRYNYPGINSQGLQRPDFSSGAFGGNLGYYNADPYRGYNAQGLVDGSLRADENISNRPEQSAAIASGDSPANSQAGRALEPLDPSNQNLERFRNFDRFPFNNQFAGNPSGNFQNFPFQSQRQDGRFAQPLIDPYNQNLPGNQNFAGNPNFQNSLGINYPRNGYQSFGDPFLQRQQGFRPNSFDYLQSQRFQNPFENPSNYPRSLQRGPNFPGFYQGVYIPGLRDNGNLATPTPRIDAKKIEQASPTELNSKSEKLATESKNNSSDNVATTESSEVLDIQGHIIFGRLFLPALEDYSDLRFQPDAFRQYLITPNANDDNNNNKTTTSSNTNTNINANTNDV